MVGVARFERAASWTRTKHSTKLSHTPSPTQEIITQIIGDVKLFYEFCAIFILFFGPTENSAGPTIFLFGHYIAVFAVISAINHIYFSARIIYIYEK